MPKFTRTDALDEISSWSTGVVVALLQKHGVEEACWKAAEKRQIDGDELLHLTEGKLTLWKSDLTRPLIWNLWTFVEELKKNPEKYAEDKPSEQQPEQQPEQQQQQPQPPSEPPPPITVEVTSEVIQQHQSQIDVESDTGWDTDFEDSVDDTEEESNSDMKSSSIRSSGSLNFRSNLKLFQNNDRLIVQNDVRGSNRSLNKIEKVSNKVELLPSDTIYANCEDSEAQTIYTNISFDSEEAPIEDASTTANNESPKNPSGLHNKRLRKSLAEELKEQLLLRGALLEGSTNTKPTVTAKPEGLVKRKDEVSRTNNEPRSSFLHKTGNAKVNGSGSVVQKNPSTSPANDSPALKPPAPNNHNHNNNNNNEETIRNLPKPPVTIRGFDLVANLPTRSTDESENDEAEDYELFDEQIIKRNSLISRTDSKQSLSSNSIKNNSVESVYNPTSSVGHEEGEVDEIYESITESPEENGHDYTSKTNSKNQANPPPLPSKPPPIITTLHNHMNKTESKTERSLEKKSATLPHSGSNTSISSNNAARPLPPPPDKQSYYERPWFHNLTREEANLLIEEQCTYGKAPDGFFLMRPSTTNPNNPLTLVLWCKDRVYNVPVRRRPDNRYALGSSKPDEQSFASVDEIIPFYKKECLNLYTGGVQTGSTRLTDTPTKEKLNIS